MAKKSENDSRQHGQLVQVWAKKSPLQESFVRELSSVYEDLQLDLQSASQTLNCSPAELYAHLKLMDMDKALAVLFYADVPPKTTWLQLLSVEPEVALNALEKFNAIGKLQTRSSPWAYMNQLLKGDTLDPDEKVRRLSYELLIYIRKKAKTYGSLHQRELGLLSSAAKYKKDNKELSPKQSSWLLSILRKLRDTGVITEENNKDGDLAESKEILEAIAGD